MNPTNPLFSIIIPTYNEERHIGNCLKSIFEQNYPTDDFEVIVVDNGSTDQTVTIAEKYPVSVLVDETKTVAGLRNLGARNASGDILAFVDADCMVSRIWLKHAENYVDDKMISAWGTPPNIPENGTWVQKTWYLVRKKHDIQVEVDWLESMNQFVRKDQFLSIGGFNEELVTCEDVDLSYRLQQFGKIISDNRIEVVHLGEAASVKEFIKKELWRGQSNFTGLMSHGLTVNEIPSLLIPIYFAIFLPIVFIGFLITLNSTWLIFFFFCYAAPTLAGLYKVRGKIASKSEIFQFIILLQVYYVVRSIAAIRGGITHFKRNKKDVVNSAEHIPEVQFRDISGIVFDVDGTLYHQGLLRVLMVAKLMIHHLVRPGELMRVIKVIRQYRDAQESLRQSTKPVQNPLLRQLDLTVESSIETGEYIKMVISKWFQKAPLSLIPICRRRGLIHTLGELKGKGFKLGVYSDYPAAEKLKALGVDSLFPIVVDGTITDLRGFKPNSNGFAITSQKMKLMPSKILYVGDRPAVDGAGAVAAGMSASIIDGKIRRFKDNRFLYLKNLSDLTKMLCIS